jgi:hypothetical protein
MSGGSLDDADAAFRAGLPSGEAILRDLGSW